MSEPTATELTQAAQIEQLQMELLQMKARLDSYEQSDTIPPSSKQDEPTGDMSFARDVAMLSMRIDRLEERESTRAHALQDISEKLDRVLERDAIDERTMDRVVMALQSEPRCAECPNRKLSLVPGIVGD